MVQCLLDHGASPGPGDEIISPLCQGARGGFLKSARCLLDQDAVDTDSWLLDDPQFSALPWAAAHCHQEIVGLLFVQVDYIHLASQGDDHFFRASLPHKQAVLLCVAAACGKLAFVQQLLETHHYDANTWLRFSLSRWGLPTPLCWAVDRGHADIVELLLVHGTETFPSLEYRVGPLSLAIQNGHDHIVVLLLAVGVDSNYGANAKGDPTLAQSPSFAACWRPGLIGRLRYRKEPPSPH